MGNLQARLASLQAHLEKKGKAKTEQVAADPRHKITENTVVKSNALARSYYRFDIVEKRIMEAMISKIDSRLADQEQCQFIELQATEYAKAYGVAPPKSYQEMAKAVERLISTVITIRGEESRKQYSLMSYAEYVDGEGKIIASFNPLIAKHLIGLRKHFMSYKLEKAVNFRSSYTWRLFELMMSWKKSNQPQPIAGWFTVSVDELKKMLGAPDNYRWVNLKQRALDSSIKEIERELDIKIWYTPIKKGRKIEMLKFEFMEDDQRKLELE